MGFIRNIAQRLGVAPSDFVTASANPESPWAGDPIGQFTLEQLYKLVGDRIIVTRDRAMKLSVISKARRTITGTINRLPLFTVDAATGIRTDRQPSLLRQPERGLALSETLMWTTDALMFQPTTWWLVTERDYYGWPMFVRWVPRHEARLDSSGKLIGAFGQPVTDDKDVIEFRSPDGGLLLNADDTIRRAILLLRAASHAEQNPVPSIDLHNTGEDLDDTEIDKMIERWVTARSKHGVGYTSKGLEVNALGQNVEQLLIDGRKAIDLELVRHTGLPAWAADAPIEGTALNYNNVASRRREILDIACSPYMTVIQDRLSLGDVTPGTQRVIFDADQFTRDDLKTRFETYKLGRDGGFVTNAWIAEQEGWQDAAPEPEPASTDQGDTQ